MLRAQTHGTMQRDQSLLVVSLNKLRHLILFTALFSAVINILMLTGPLFMLQVYDRVLASRSVPTLAALFALVCGLYLCLGLFEFFRSRILSRMAYRLDAELMKPLQKLWVMQNAHPNLKLARPIQELSVVRQFMAGNGPSAFFDLPWVPVFLALVFALHFWLGLLALGGAVVVVVIALVNSQLSQKPLENAAGEEASEYRLSEIVGHNAESILSMGMLSAVLDRLSSQRMQAMGEGQKAGGVQEMLAATSKAVRLLMQSALLALGAYLAIYQEITAGAMIAASILAGRALAPIDQVVGQWRGFIRARLAYDRLRQIFELTSNEEVMSLPEPKGHLTISGVSKFVPSSSRASEPRIILHGLHFELKPGDGLGVIGPSASGKSSLARLLTGLWFPDRGEVRLDGARFDQWDRDALGRHVGYLPQRVELIPGTIRDNIARFDPQASDDDIVKAAQQAGVHELILALPGGYLAEVEGGDLVLSGGQIQRIALARAVYKLPKLVVLDEPNSNLDAEGEEALTRAIAALRKAGSVVVVMAHRPSAIAAVNLVLMLKGGQQVAFGPKEEVLRQVTQTVKPVQVAG